MERGKTENYEKVILRMLSDQHCKYNREVRKKENKKILLIWVIRRTLVMELFQYGHISRG